MHTQSPRAWHGTELPRKPLLTTCGRDRQTHKQTDTGSPCPIPLILAPDIAPPPFFLPLPPTPRVPSPCKPSLPLGAGGESRSTLGTIRGLGRARVAGPGGGQGDMGAGVGGKKVQGNSGTISCWGGEGRRVGVKPLGSPSSPSACHLTGDSGGWRRALDASGRSRACSGLAVHRQTVRAAGAGPAPPCPLPSHSPDHFWVPNSSHSSLPGEPAPSPSPSDPTGSPLCIWSPSPPLLTSSPPSHLP